MQSMPQLWKSLHHHCSRPSQETELEWNDDLVGVFLAVPRRDIVEAVTPLTEQFCEQSGCTILLLDLVSKTGHQGNPRGKIRTSFKRCWVREIPAIVEVSFATGIFTAAGKCRLQKEGTCVGNLISPVLSGLPVLLAEQRFVKSLPYAVCSFLFLRYVANRLIVAAVYYLPEPSDSGILQPFILQGDPA